MITNVDEVAPTITSGATGTTLVENSGAGQTVYTITAVANDGGTIQSYAIAGTDAALLAVNASTGVVSLTADPDYETKSTYSFTVTASDAAGTSTATPVTFSITDVNELGCTDPTACNYNSAANTDDGSCILPDGCTDSTALNYNSSATCDDGSCASAVGDNYQGGIIFWLDGNGGGLIAAPSDQASFPNDASYGCSGTLPPMARRTHIGSGQINTLEIINACSTPGIAARICANLTLGGYSDWFLPSKDELNKMHLNIGRGNALGLGNIGGFSVRDYWSSSEHVTILAWRQSLYDGDQGTNNKSGYHNVRAVRAF